MRIVRANSRADCLGLVLEADEQRQERADDAAENQDRDRERDEGRSRGEGVGLGAGSEDMGEHLLGEEARAGVDHEQDAEDDGALWQPGPHQVRDPAAPAAPGPGSSSPYSAAAAAATPFGAALTVVSSGLGNRRFPP